MLVYKTLLTLAIYFASVVSQNTSCHDYVLMSIRGTYERQGPSIAFLTTINTTLLADPGGIEYDVVYPAAGAQTPWIGADDAVRYIDSGLINCPNQIYAILGYSQGASATAITLLNYTDTNSAGFKAIRAILVVGNLFHKPGEVSNFDEFNGTSTRDCIGGSYNYTLSGTTPHRAAIPEIYYTSGKVLDICHTADAVCCPAWPNSTFYPDHLAYGITPLVQRMGSDFLLEKLSANGTGSSSNTTSATTSANPTSGKPTTPTLPGTPGTPTIAPSRTSQSEGAATASPTSPGVGSRFASDVFFALGVVLLTVAFV